MLRFLLLLFGVYCCSTSVIFIKISSTDPIVLSAWRLILGGSLLMPMAVRAWLRTTEPLDWKLHLRQTLPPAAFLSVHFISWILGARLTPSANASLLVNMVPVVMPFLLFFFLKERLTLPEILGTALALAGVIFLGISDFNLSREYALGDAVCFASMLFYAFYLLYARKNRTIPSIYLYVVPVYLMAGIICLLIALTVQFTGRPLIWIGPNLQNEIIAIAGLALLPTVLGHSIINWALKNIPGQTVVIINLSQFIFAGIMGFILLHEQPTLHFYLTSSLIISGALIVILKSSANK